MLPRNLYILEWGPTTSIFDAVTAPFAARWTYHRIANVLRLLLNHYDVGRSRPWGRVNNLRCAVHLYFYGRGGAVLLGLVCCSKFSGIYQLTKFTN